MDTPALKSCYNCLFLTLLVLGLGIDLMGCLSCRMGQNIPQKVLSADTAPGIILIDVLAAGEPEDYWQYEVQPTTGTVRLVREEQFQDYKHRSLPKHYQLPAGAIGSCMQNPEASSPNSQYRIYCRGAASDQLYLEDNKSIEKLRTWKLGKQIRGFAWAPNSGSIAVLNVGGHVGIRPAELLAFISGHPVSHDTVFLDIQDVRTGKITEYVVRKDVISSFTRILNWSE